MSKMESYCSLLYDRMDEQASIEENVRVWRGKLILTCTELGIPEGTYAKVVTKLRSLGCIEQVTRGYRGNAPSVFILHFPPTVDVWRQATNVKSVLTDAPTLDSLSVLVEDLRKQLGGLNLVAAFTNIEARLTQLETAVKDIKSNKASN